MSKEEDDIRLLEYIDGQLGAEDAAQLHRRLENEPELKTRLRELQALNAMVSDRTVEQPSASFTKSVMVRVNQYPRGAASPIRRGIMLLAVLLATVGLASWLVSIGMFDNTSINVNSVMFGNDTSRFSLPSLTFDGKILVNVIIIFNLVVAFFLLDRTVLKPWFQRRSRLNY